MIKTISISDNKQWQPIEVEFNSPRIGYKSYRILAEIENTNGDVIQVNIDDFSLIEWHTAFSSLAQPSKQGNIEQQATFIGLNKSIAASICHYQYCSHISSLRCSRLKLIKDCPLQGPATQYPSSKVNNAP